MHLQNIDADVGAGKFASGQFTPVHFASSLLRFRSFCFLAFTFPIFLLPGFHVPCHFASSLLRYRSFCFLAFTLPIFLLPRFYVPDLFGPWLSRSMSFCFLVFMFPVFFATCSFIHEHWLILLPVVFYLPVILLLLFSILIFCSHLRFMIFYYNFFC